MPDLKTIPVSTLPDLGPITITGTGLYWYAWDNTGILVDKHSSLGSLLYTLTRTLPGKTERMRP